MASRSFAAGETLFKAGDPGDRAFLIESGQVEVLSGATRVALLGKGEVVGEMALIEERPHGRTARALSTGSATSLTRQEFEHGLLHDPAQCRSYLIRLFERLRTLSERAPEAPPVASAATAPRVTLHPLTRGLKARKRALDSSRRHSAGVRFSKSGHRFRYQIVSLIDPATVGPRRLPPNYSSTHRPRV